MHFLRAFFRRAVATALVLVGALASAAQSPAVAGSAAPPARRVLFLGNSLTAANDLPALVQAMARAQGLAFDYRAVTHRNYAIEDHWTDGTARLLTAGEKWDVLVLQQGPSSRPESRAHLLQWSQTWADAARRDGTTTALYMVWPMQGQPDGFALVARSYREAATGSRARLFPAGEAWAAVLAASDAPTLYSSDGLHPTPAGTFLAAMVVARGLTGLDPAHVPARLTLASGEIVSLPESTVAAFRTVVARLRFD